MSRATLNVSFFWTLSEELFRAINLYVQTENSQGGFVIQQGRN